MKAGNLILGRKENLKREIASLTKIMTFYTALDLCERYRLNPDKIQIKVTKCASNIIGTSALLRFGDTFTMM